MISLKPIYQTKAHEKVVFDRIKDFLDELLFGYIDEVMSENPLENAGSVIIDGLKSGKIVYKDGYFIIKGRISNRLALEIELLGGKYNRHVGGYKVPEKTLPVDVAQTIAQINIGNRDKIDKIDNYLKNLDETKQYAFDNLSFNDEVNKIGTDLDGQFKKSVSKIDVIPADMNEYQKEEIANNYTKNMKYYIQKWTDQEIVKLRQDLEPFIMGGVRTGDLAKVIQQHKGVTDRKAKFLARQETKLLISEYQRNRFKQAGVTHYRWSTNIDGRERAWHRKLNGQIFSWDNPPIIDERTGERGHPGQTYNCRCVAVPLVDFVVENSKDDKIQWITIRGNPFPLKDGQDKKEAIKEFIESKQTGSPKEWGKAYTAYKQKPEEAIDKLIKEKGGHVPEAIYKKGIGLIDFVWGESGKPNTNEGYGLAHIIRRRSEHNHDGIQFAKSIPSIIKHGKVYREEGSNRAYIETKDKTARISFTWKQDQKTWLLTAFFKGGKDKG